MDETITPEWLESVGFWYSRIPRSEYRLGPYVWSLVPMPHDHYGLEDSGGTILAVMKTRQDVLDLCRALGSPLAAAAMEKPQ